MQGRKLYHISLTGLVCLGIGVMSAARGQIQVQNLGTAAPPGSLGGYGMTAFGTDPTAEGSSILTLASPLGGLLTFGSPVRHDIVGSDWATWSHSYSGDVYDSGAGVNSVTLGLPGSTLGFYFYAEPNDFGALWDITATAQSGTTLTINNVDANGGAVGFGFYGTSSLDYITSITVTTTDAEFAVGEFGIYSGSPGPSSVPEGGSSLLYAILGLVGCCGYGCWSGGQRRTRVGSHVS